MKLLIAFNGGYGSGKSTACNLLRDRHLSRLALVKFAQPLYDIQEFAYRRIAAAYPRKADFAKDRKLLQWLGTEWGRGLREDLWVKLWQSEVNYTRANPECDIILNDDIRFDNEARAVREMGGFIIRIERDHAAAHALGGTGIVNHASENGLPAHFIDRVVTNNGTIEEFEQALLGVISDLKQSKGEK